MSTPQRLELTDVTQRFGRVRALDRVSFQLPASGVVALVGPNGAGKSTLLDVLFGALRPSHGHVIRAGTTKSLTGSFLYRYFTRLHQRVVMPEDVRAAAYLCLALNPRQAWTLSDMLARDWCEPGGFEERLPSWSLNLLRSAAILKGIEMPIGQLSYGQQRVVAMAALFSVPGRRGILLDEPFVGLADAAKTAVREAITSYAERRLVVLAEHDLDVAREIADEMIVLVGGQLVAHYKGDAVRSADLLGHFMSGEPA